MKIKEKKKAVSLIVLVITVIVLSILAATVIVSISDTDVISETNKTVFKADMANYKEVYEMYVTKETLKDISFNSTSLDGKYSENEESFKKIFGDIPEKYQEGLAVEYGRLVYETADSSKKEILEDLDMCPKEVISKETSYVGCYADTDGDGVADGVIFADLANNNGSTSYSEVEDTTTLKDYVICKSSYTVENATGFGEHPVLSVKKSEIAKSDRFYVMALEDTSSGAGWYSNAGTSNSISITDRSIVSSSFGSGKLNTDTMVAAWNREEYGTRISGDMWGVIQNITSKYNYANGWFIPSGSEWRAFKQACGISKSNYTTSFELKDFYWTSNLASSTPCGELVMNTVGGIEYTFVYSNGRMDGYAYLYRSAAVRLATTF